MRHKMIDKPNSNAQSYEIRLKGHLEAHWVDWFDGLAITLEEDGDTLLTGPVVDQAALHALLKKVRDLGMPLISVVQVRFNETHQIRSIKGAIKMITSETATKKIDTKVLLSTLWIVVMINMLMADILSLYIPGAYDELAKAAGDTPIPLLMLGGAIMMEISILMIILSRVLKYSVNRWVNIITSIITIAFVIGGGATYPHYIFIATVEVVCLLLIAWNAWKWHNPEG